MARRKMNENTAAIEAKNAVEAIEKEATGKDVDTMNTTNRIDELKKDYWKAQDEYLEEDEDTGLKKNYTARIIPGRFSQEIHDSILLNRHVTSDTVTNLLSGIEPFINEASLETAREAEKNTINKAILECENNSTEDNKYKKLVEDMTEAKLRRQKIELQVSKQRTEKENFLKNMKKVDDAITDGDYSFAREYIDFYEERPISPMIANAIRVKLAEAEAVEDSYYNEANDEIYKEDLKQRQNEESLEKACTNIGATVLGLGLGAAVCGIICGISAAITSKQEKKEEDERKRNEVYDMLKKQENLNKFNTNQFNNVTDRLDEAIRATRNMSDQMNRKLAKEAAEKEKSIRSTRYHDGMDLFEEIARSCTPTCTPCEPKKPESDEEV
jgi:hypothetical protein